MTNQSKAHIGLQFPICEQ